jgi:glycosyltransferase involved in cell wall biosynthesis
MIENIKAPDSGIDVTIVIPCKNEAPRISSTLDEVIASVKEVGCSYEVLVMDDGSTDDTSEMVMNYLKNHPDCNICLHKNPKNFGLSRSYVDGAFLGTGKYYRLVCGDNVEPKETMAQILRLIGKADIVIPYYESLPGKPPLRQLISNFYTMLVNTVSGYSINYYNGCGLHLREHVLRWHSYSFGFGFQADFTTRLLLEGASYIQVPVVASHTVKEKSGSPLNLRNFISTGHTLAEILRRRINHWLFER